MDTIKKIEEIIKRRNDLTNKVERANGCLQHGINNAADMFVHPVSASGHNLRIPFALMRPVIEEQMQVLTNELRCIDKQLEAIGALMGVKDEPAAQ